MEKIKWFSSTKNALTSLRDNDALPKDMKNVTLGYVSALRYADNIDDGERMELLNLASIDLYRYGKVSEILLEREDTDNLEKIVKSKYHKLLKIIDRDSVVQFLAGFTDSLYLTLDEDETGESMRRVLYGLLKVPKDKLLDWEMAGICDDDD